MLNSVEIRNSRDQTLALPLWDTSSGYAVTNIDGLDPVQASLVTSTIASMDGEQYQAARRAKRNILMTIGMEAFDDTSVRMLRQSLYSFFMPKTPVTLRFQDTDGSLVSITGRIESFSAPLFAKEPQGTVSIVCFDPDFYSANDTVVEGLTTSSQETQSFFYEGSTDTGFIFEMQVPWFTIPDPDPATASFDGFTFYLTGGDNTLQSFEVNYNTFQAGDRITIGTVPGNKYVRLRRNGIEASILYGKAQGSTWGTITPGSNRIRVVRSDGISGGEFSLTYKAKFGGL